MRATAVLQIGLLLIPYLHVTVAQFSNPFPFGGFPQIGPHWPFIPPAHHPFPQHSPQPQHFQFPHLHPAHHNQELQGRHNQFELLRTNEHLTEHGSDGNRLETGSQRMIGRQLKYDLDNKHGKDNGKGVWNTFGHEIKYGVKEQLNTYAIPEKPVDNSHRYIATNDYNAPQSFHFRGHPNEPNRNWYHKDSYGIPYVAASKENPEHYEQPSIGYGEKHAERNERSISVWKPNLDAKRERYSSVPNIGQYPYWPQSYESHVSPRAKQMRFQNRHSNQKQYQPQDDIYVDEYHEIPTKDGRFRTKHAFSYPSPTKTWKHIPSPNKYQQKAQHYYSSDDYDHQYYRYPNNLLEEEGWEELDPLDPIVKQLNLIDDSGEELVTSEHSFNRHY